MPHTDKIKIGLIHVPREIEIEVDDADALIQEFEKSFDGDGPVWWVTENDGRRHGLVVDKVAYVDIEPGRDRSAVGFG